MKQYLDMLRHILEKGAEKENRTGVNTIGVFGYQTRYDLQEGFPLLTTKKMFLKGVIEELLWFISGDTNIKTLVDKNVNIWNEDAYREFKKREGFSGETLDDYVAKIKTDPEFARKHGDLGPVYGKQWRNFNGIDQFKTVVDSIKKSPDSRRLIVSAWNPSDVPKMALPPCHTMYHFNIHEGKLCCQLYQRSADAFLGVPFNIASYALLTIMMGKETGYPPGEFVHTFGDLHIYKNHTEAVQEQLKREPRKLPTLEINTKDIYHYTLDDFVLKDYDPYPTIKAKLNV
jgi:thymidylate synthase